MDINDDQKKRHFLILDANILIDFCQCDRTVFKLIYKVLVESGGLPAEDATDIILKMQEINPKYITDNIVKKAFKRIGVADS